MSTRITDAAIAEDSAAERKARIERRTARIQKLMDEERRAESARLLFRALTVLNDVRTPEEAGNSYDLRNRIRVHLEADGYTLWVRSR